MLESRLSRSSRYFRYVRATSRAIAAKNATVSSVSTTSSALPPPGSATSSSATSAMTPNFQASCTRGSVSVAQAPGGARCAAMLLLDGAGTHEDEHERPQHDPVDHEDDRGVVGEEAQQERDRGVARDEGEQGRHRQRAEPHVLALLPAEDRPELDGAA